MSATGKVRWGILGAARINERFLPALTQTANAELVAIASRRAGAAAETLAQHAPQLTNVRTYDHLESLLDDSVVEAIYLPLANHEHAEWTLRAIERGKHVLCEKPLALRAGDIEAIALAAKQQGVIVMEGFMYRFHPQHERVREIIQSGIIGDVGSVRASYSFMMRPARLYRLAESIERGGGAMWDIGCYAVHSARQFFDNDPIAVTAIAKYVESGADITTSGVLDFGEGKRAHFDVSFECARRNEYEVTGTKGGVKCHTVWLLPDDVPVISWWTEDGQRAEERLPAANHFQLEIEHFSDCVRTGNAPLLSLNDARANCQTIVAALQSAAEGKAVRL